MKRFAFIFTILIVSLSLNGQDPEAPAIKTKAPTFPRYNIGLGAGIDYGGFGGRFTLLTSERLEFFGALGYNLLGVGFNAGADFRLMPKSRVCPYIGAMYGYNAVIKVTGAEMYNQTYYGPSWSLGMEFWSRRNTGFFNLELIIPMRSSEFHDDLNNLKNNPNIDFSSEPLPVGFSIGYHFMF